MISPFKLTRAHKRVHQRGGFGIEILWPGLPLENGDSGVGAIGRIDHARLQPGTLVKMHPHKDDEILTYVRRGTLVHRDSIGQSETVSSSRLMLMNAGHTFQHEEETPSQADTLEALQIFMRPRAADLEPVVQFHDFGMTYSENSWRLIAGPDQAPLTLRADAWIHDARLGETHTLTLPALPVAEVSRLLYVFSGEVSAAGMTLTEGEGVLLGSDDCEVRAQRTSDLVLFTNAVAATVFKGGMYSGNTVP